MFSIITFLNLASEEDWLFLATYGLLLEVATSSPTVYKYPFGFIVYS